MTRKQALRAILGLLAALFSAGFALFVAFGLFPPFHDPQATFSEIWRPAFAMASVVVAFAFPFVLVGGSILYAAFRWRRWFSPWRSMMGGALLGALVAPVSEILAGRWQNLFSLEVLGIGFLGALLGTVGGLAFWFVAVRHLDQNRRLP